jgi:hypothetical protein
MRETPFSALPVAVGYILLLAAPSAPWSMTASARIENLEKIGLSELRTQTQTFMFQPQLDPARTEVPFTAKVNISKGPSKTSMVSLSHDSKFGLYLNEGLLISEG